MPRVLYLGKLKSNSNVYLFQCIAQCNESNKQNVRSETEAARYPFSEKELI